MSGYKYDPQKAALWMKVNTDRMFWKRTQRDTDMDNFEAQIKPFFWSEYKDIYSFCLDAGGYKDELFDTRADEGFEGSGYDWSSLAQVFLNEKMPELSSVLKFDPEAGMFCVYSNDKEAILAFGKAFKAACEDDELIADLFSRAEPD